MMEAMPAAQEDDSRLQMAYAAQSLEKGLGGNLVSAVLFGSGARGDAEEGSNWGLQIIARGLRRRHLERLRGLKEFLPTQWRGRLSILAKTPEEFEAALPTIYLEIALDGLILYDTGGHADKRLQRLRRLLRSKGLHQEMRGKDSAWRWDSFPGFGWSVAREES